MVRSVGSLRRTHHATRPEMGRERVRVEVHVIAETEHSVWADVRWFHDGTDAERFVYQLVRSDGAWKIAVLTPMGT